MAVSHHMHTALLTEHFRYTPLTLLDDIINTVNEIVFRAVNALEQGLGEIPADALGFKLTREQHDATKSLSEAAREQLLSEMKQTEIEQGIVKLESLLNSTVDKDFDKFEIYTLRNILAVGHQEEDLVPWVRLKHYQGLDFDEVVRTASNAQGQHTELPSPEELQVRRRKLQETKKLNAMLKAEEARNAVVLEQLRALRTKSTSLTGDGQDRPAPLACLVAAASSTSKSGRSLTQDTQYAMKQLPVLRELLGRLKDSLDTLPNARYADEDEDSAAASRRRYLDSQSLRAVERRRVDAEMGPAMTLAGRRIDKSEVEGVKAVLEAFQRGNVQDEKPEDEEMEGE